MIVSLSGTGVSAPKINVSPIPLNFGNVAMLQNRQLALTISNRGTDILIFQTEVHNPARTSPTFSVNVDSGSVVAGGQRIITATFSPHEISNLLPTLPPDTSNLSGTLVIRSNDIYQPVIDVPMSGKGTAATLHWHINYWLIYVV